MADDAEAPSSMPLPLPLPLLWWSKQAGMAKDAKAMLSALPPSSPSRK
jgi:hypothetical protein